MAERLLLELLTEGAMFDVMDKDKFFLGNIKDAHMKATTKMYLQKRDQYRMNAVVQRGQRWKYATVKLAADMWCNRSSSITKRGHDIRLVFDKL
jgi:hypothetical protein